MNHTNEGGCCVDCRRDAEGVGPYTAGCYYPKCYCHTPPQTSSAAVEEVESAVRDAAKRLMEFEHESSAWQGQMVYEASDFDGYLNWLHSRLTKLVEEAEERGYKRALLNKSL